jgi:hypothetical protein
MDSRPRLWAAAAAESFVLVKLPLLSHRALGLMQRAPLSRKLMQLYPRARALVHLTTHLTTMLLRSWRLYPRARALVHLTDMLLRSWRAQRAPLCRQLLHRPSCARELLVGPASMLLRQGRADHTPLCRQLMQRSPRAQELLHPVGCDL